MRTLISDNPIASTTPPFFLFHFPSLSRENKRFLRISHPKSPRYPKPPISPSIGASPISFSSSSSCSSYGGWGEQGLGIDSGNSGESTQLHRFLVSIGIDDKKHVFTFLFGVVCAFAISRVRISSIFVLPASVLVFAVGFSFGFVRGGSFNEFGFSSSKRKAKEEIFRIYGERFLGLASFFEGLDVKVSDLKSDIQRAIDTKQIELDDLENYVSVIESVKWSASDARKVIDGAIDGAGNSSGVLAEDQKSSSSRKRKEIGEVAVQLFQFVAGLFGQKMVNSKPNKMKEKENVKQGSGKGLANDQPQGSSSTTKMRETDRDSLDRDKVNSNLVFSQGESNQSTLDWDKYRTIKIVSGKAEVKSVEIGGTGKRFIDDEEYSYQSDRLRFVKKPPYTQKMDKQDQDGKWKSHDNLLDSVDFSACLRHAESDASFLQQQIFGKKLSNNGTDGCELREEMVTNDSQSADHHSVLETEGDSTSSAISDDVFFDRYLTEANGLLKQAKDCMRGRYDEELAEIMLYKSARLLTKAIMMKPMSLLAVGQLGNTYLLHGELKLKISRELRTLLSRHDPLSFEHQTRILKGPDNQVINRDKIASLLVNVCEECEELLVEAGRKYRLALSIDGNDVRALYNWGLALSFRAQLIADIGPEAAFDADKVFLAAIDKFDAMMSKGNVYAPDALYRWGVVLQQRSHLRPTNSKEKLKLLQQAKRLYEDALNMDSDNRHREATALLRDCCRLRKFIQPGNVSLEVFPPPAPVEEAEDFVEAQ